MNLEELNRLAELERRLARLESILNVPATPAAPVPAPKVAVPPPNVPVAALPQAPSQPLPQPTHAPVQAAAPIPPPRVAARTEPLSSAKNSSFEKKVGLQWAGRAGALALAAAIAMGVKYAYDNGWFNQVPPGARVLFTALMGFSLIALGEWVYRKINQHAAAGLFGAGVAALFVAAYAGNAFYNLYPQTTAFWLAGLATLIGAALSMRGKMAAVAALSILGGTLAPVILSSGQDPNVSLLIYALFLQVLALFLAWWGNSTRWWALRVLALVSTTVWFAVVISFYVVAKPVMLGFLLFGGMLFHAELVASAVRSSLRTGQDKLLNTLGDTSAAVFSFIVTMLMCGAGFFVFDNNWRAESSIWVLGLAVFFGLQSWILPRMLGACVKPLANSFQCQAALLALLAVPLAVKNPHAIAIGWALLAVAFAWLGLLQQNGLPLVFTLLALLAGALFWGFRELLRGDHSQWSSLLNPFTAAGLALMVAHAVSAAITDKLDNANTPRKFDALSMLFRAAIPLIFLFDGTLEIHNFFHPDGYDWFDFSAAEQVALSTFWALTAIALVLLGFRFSKPALRIAGLAFFGFTLIKVVLIDGSFLSSGYRVLSFMGVGALLLVTSVLYGKFKKD